MYGVEKSKLPDKKQVSSNRLAKSDKLSGDDKF
jgi:hypothetical protein